MITRAELRKQLLRLEEFLADPYLAAEEDFGIIMLKILADNPACDLTAEVNAFRKERGVMTHEEHSQKLRDEYYLRLARR